MRGFQKLVGKCISKALGTEVKMALKTPGSGIGLLVFKLQLHLGFVLPAKVRPGRLMAQVLGSLPSSWEAEKVFPAPRLSLA